jgi:hypothetical protein
MAGEHHEPDGIAEAIDDLLRTSVLLGARLAERHARACENALRDAARHSLDHARAEQDRQHAARRQALTQLEGVFSDSWWEHASADDIRHAWTSARSYQHDDAHAARGVWRIADQLRDRHGLDAFEIDPAALGTRVELEQRTPITGDELDRYARHLAGLRAKLDADTAVPHDAAAEEILHARRAEIDELRDLVGEERARLADETADDQTPERRRARERRDVDAAVAVGGDSAQQLAAPGYDTRERRTLLAERLTALDLDPEAVHAAVLADAANAQPPEMAAATQPRDAPHARVSSQARRGARQARRPR